MAPIKYKLIKNFFNKEELKLLKIYCNRKMDLHNDFNIDQYSFSPAWYHDSFMYSLLVSKTPLVEEQTNLKLFPTYTYWRYYIFGATLMQHNDRPSCEISASVCIEKRDDWAFEIEGESFFLEEGDAVLYAGCVHRHGRPGIYKGEGMAQVFFHYVNKNGPFSHHKYDEHFKSHNVKGTTADMELVKKLQKEHEKNNKS